MIFLMDNTIHTNTAAHRYFAGTFVFAAIQFLAAAAHASVITRARCAAALGKIFLIVLHHIF
jgi:hypothetical protein